jgi:signal transduction histidine kinase
VLALGVAVLLVTRRNIGRPIEKLVAGVRDVSAGDLSRVVLQEREDEIGVLAARFNEMTASLREARAETRRGVEARLQLEESLRRSEKLAAIGSLAAGIAHEVGTPLNVIYGRARALERKAGEAAEVQKNATIIAEQAARITKIIQQLLDVARRRTPMRTEVDLGRLARATLDFLEHQLAAHAIRARLSAEAEPTRVVGDPDQLQQVLLNLCLNAIQAMAGQGQGSLAISLSQVTRRKPGLDRAAPVDYAVLTVEDSGNGIAQEHRAHIFEPFYSTKSDGKGTGLGLPVCQSIVEEHDGFIEVDSREGSGSRFRVFLPRPAVDGAENAPDGPPPSASPTTPASATATAAAVPAQAVAAAVPAQAVAAAVPITPAAAVAVPATTALAVSATAVPALPEEEAHDHD